MNMKIKSTVWQVLAAGSFGAGLLYALGIEGTAQVGGVISDGQFVTVMVLILLALFLMRLGFAVQDAEEQARRKVHKEPQNTVKSRKKVG
jgi:Na+/H+ antiporter NhaC